MGIIHCFYLTHLVPVKLPNGPKHRDVLLLATLGCQKKTPRRMSMSISVLIMAALKLWKQDHLMPISVLVVAALKLWKQDHLQPLPTPLPQPLLPLLSSL